MMMIYRWGVVIRLYRTRNPHLRVCFLLNGCKLKTVVSLFVNLFVNVPVIDRGPRTSITSPCYVHVASRKNHVHFHDVIAQRYIVQYLNRFTNRRGEEEEGESHICISMQCHTAQYYIAHSTAHSTQHEAHRTQRVVPLPPLLSSTYLDSLV